MMVNAKTTQRKSPTETQTHACAPKNAHRQFHVFKRRHRGQQIEALKAKANLAQPQVRQHGVGGTEVHDVTEQLQAAVCRVVNGADSLWRNGDTSALAAERVAAERDHAHREQERDRDRETERQNDRGRDRDKQTETHRDRDRNRDRDRDRQTDRQTDRHRERDKTETRQRQIQRQTETKTQDDSMSGTHTFSSVVFPPPLLPRICHRVNQRIGVRGVVGRYPAIRSYKHRTSFPKTSLRQTHAPLQTRRGELGRTRFRASGSLRVMLSPSHRPRVRTPS